MSRRKQARPNRVTDDLEQDPKIISENKENDGETLPTAPPEELNNNEEKPKISETERALAVQTLLSNLQWPPASPSVTLEAIQNTKVAVAQFAASALTSTDIADLSMLQSTLYTLQQQQLLQLQLIQQLQHQLNVNANSNDNSDIENNEEPSQDKDDVDVDVPEKNNGLSSAFSKVFNCPNQDPNRPLSPGLEISGGQGGNQTSGEGSTLDILQKRAQEVLDSASQGLLASSLADERSKKLGPYEKGREPFFKHRCRYCGKVFGSDSALQIHIRSHTGERPFKCNVCGSRFTTKGNLKVHFQRHTQKFPHVKMNPHPVPEHLDAFHPPLINSPEEEDKIEFKTGFEGPKDRFEGGGIEFKDRFEGGGIEFKDRMCGDRFFGPNPFSVFSGSSFRPLEKRAGSPLAKSASESEPEGVEIKTEAEEPPTEEQHDDPSRESTEEEEEEEEEQPQNLSRNSFSRNASPTMNDRSSPPLDNPQQNPHRPQSNPPPLPNPGHPGVYPGGFHPSLSAPPSLTPSFDPSKDPSVYTSLLPRPGSNDNAWESLIEITKTSETSKLQMLVDNIEHKLTDPNQCIICHRVLSCKSALQMHYRTHTGERPFKCKICGRAFTTKGNLKTHMGVHRAKAPLRVLHQCPVCHKRFTNALVLQQHIRLHTGEPTDLTPDQIRAAEVRDFSFNPFNHAHFNNFYKSDEEEDESSCEPTTSIAALENQVRTIATHFEGSDTPKRDAGSGGRDAVIESAGIESAGIEITKDESDESNSVKDLALDLTPKKNNIPVFNPFINHNINHFTHLLRHPLDPHYHLPPGLPPPPPPWPLPQSPRGATTCHICLKTFACNSALEIHYRSHTKERPFKCNVCERGFSTKGNMKQHQLTHKQAGPQPDEHSHDEESLPSQSEDLEDRKDSSPEDEGPPQKRLPTEEGPPQKLPRLSENGGVEEGRHVCGVCTKNFSSSSALHIHSRTHTGDRPFKCNVCDKAFTTKGNLKVHLGTHAWSSGVSRRGRRMSLDPLTLFPNQADRAFFPFNLQIKPALPE